jgi:hypothetical protein
MKKKSKSVKKAMAIGPATPSPTPREQLAAKIEAGGPDPAAIAAASRAALEHASVRKLLGNARHRLVDFRLVEPEPEIKAAGSRLRRTVIGPRFTTIRTTGR